MIRAIPSAVRSLAVGAAVGLVFAVLFQAGAFEQFELKTLDMRFHLNAGNRTPSDDIVIVTIDQNSIDYLKNRVGILWKWPRDVYGYVLQYVNDAGARAVLLDFDFSDPDINRAEFEEGQTDTILGEAIAESGNVVNSFLMYRSPRAGKYVEDTTDYEILKEFSIDVTGAESLKLRENSSAVTPIPAIMAPSRALGTTNIRTDTDGIIRKAPLLQLLEGKIYANTALALAMVMRGTDRLTIGPDNTLEFDRQRIPLTERGEMILNWYGPGGPEGGAYKYYPIADVLLSYMQTQNGIAPTLPPQMFWNKTVLIGSNAPSLYDLKTTPFSGNRAYPGVEIVATAVNNLLDGSALKRQSRWTATVLILLVCILTTLVVGFVRSVAQNVALTLLLAAGVYAYAWGAFRQFLFVDLVPMEAGVLFTFTAVTVMNYLTEGREKKWLKKAFSQYISSSVMEEITRHPEKLKLGGERREVTVLFSDIRGFTSISEKLDAGQLTNILNEYLTPMTDTVLRRQGTLDKYIGDAVMAFFGAPLELDNHAASACETALDMLEELGRLKADWARQGLPDFIQSMNIGIGLNSGIVSVGNMGSLSRFDYTVMGDNVNLSSRLEGSTKLYGVNVIVSESTYNMTNDRFVFRELDRIRVVGKQIPITIYELLGRRDGSEKERLATDRASEFERAVTLYRDRRWDEALKGFESIVESSPGDKASALYIQRCTDFRTSPPPPDWDGVFERSSK